MWLTTIHGFISAVRDNENPGYVLLRFRSRAHAEGFAKRLNAETSDPHAEFYTVRETPVADYRWKFSVPVDTFAMMAADLATEAMDYPNFKSACHDAPLMKNHDRPLYAVWHAWHDVQVAELNREPKPGRAPQHRAEDFEDLAWPNEFREPRPAPKPIYGATVKRYPEDFEKPQPAAKKTPKAKPKKTR